MKSILSIIGLTLFLNSPLRAQEQNLNAIHINFNSFMALPAWELNANNSYHHKGMGISLEYDRLLFPKLGLGISLKAGMQSSSLIYSVDPTNKGLGLNLLITNNQNLEVLCLGIGPQINERLGQDLHLLTKFFVGYNLALLDLSRTMQTENLDRIGLSLIDAPFYELSMDLIFALNEKLSLSMGGHLSYCTLELENSHNSNLIEKVNYNNIGFNTGFRIKF